MTRRTDDPLGDIFDGFADAVFGFGEAFGQFVEHAFVRPVEMMSDIFEAFPAGTPDPQRQAVYDWHFQVIEPWAAKRGIDGHMTLEECRQLASRVFKAFGYPPPRVEPVTGNIATGLAALITIPPHMMRLTIMLHEMAHGLAELHNPTRPAHGPIFVAFFYLLMEMYAGAERRWILQTLRRRGVQYARIRPARKKR